MNSPNKLTAAKIGIRPMEATTLDSSHVVTITKKDVSPNVSVEAKFKPQWSRKSYPEALWSHKPAAGKPEAGMIKDVPSGVVLRVGPTKQRIMLVRS